MDEINDEGVACRKGKWVFMTMIVLRADFDTKFYEEYEVL